jgi:mRNA-degrading endonuclease YafQ of YafQ-DinJ toxin-antitoxin module
MYRLEFEKGFWKTVEKITGKDKKLWSRIELAINRLKQDPYNPSLRTHKVNTRKYGENVLVELPVTCV